MHYIYFTVHMKQIMKSERFDIRSRCSKGSADILLSQANSLPWKQPSTPTVMGIGCSIQWIWKHSKKCFKINSACRSFTGEEDKFITQDPNSETLQHAPILSQHQHNTSMRITPFWDMMLHCFVAD
jgi:hypothetical protein